MANLNLFYDKINDSSRSKEAKEARTLINTLLETNNKRRTLSALSVNDNLVSDSKSMAETLNDYLLILGRR